MVAIKQTKHVDTKIGAQGPGAGKSYLDISAAGVVMPKGAENLPRLAKIEAGWDIDFFDSDLNPIHLDIFAGTEGTITLFLDVTYNFYEWPDGYLPTIAPDKKNGTISCKRVWYYKCTDKGELGLIAFPVDDPEPDDNFSVVIDKLDQANPQPRAGILPYVMMVARPSYAGNKGKSVSIPIPIPETPIKIPVNVPLSPGTPGGSGSSIQLLASLNIVGVVPSPPPPPPPPRKAPLVWPAIIPFAKENQTSLDNAAREIASNWAAALFQINPKLQEPMMRGDIPVYFVGYASATGKKGETVKQVSDDFNVDIGQARATAVAKYLTPHLGSGAKMFYRSVGRRYAKWSEVFDDKLQDVFKITVAPRAIDRIVVVWVDLEEAMKAVNK